jgi:hypothetical protein
MSSPPQAKKRRMEGDDKKKEEDKGEEEEEGEKCTDCGVKADSLEQCKCEENPCELCDDCIEKANLAKRCERCDALLCKRSCLTYGVRQGLMCGAALEKVLCATLTITMRLWVAVQFIASNVVLMEKDPQ